MRLELWQRNLAALFVGQTMTAIAFSFIFPFIPLYVQVLGVTGTTEAAQWAGTIAAAAALAMAVTQPIWGNMADRWGRKPMVVRAMLGGGGTIILMGFATSPEQLLFLRFVQGCLMGTMAASTALVAASTPRDRLGFALGLIQVAMFVGNSLGPLVGGLIADTLGYRIAFQLAGGLMLVAAALVITVVREQFVRPQGGAAHDGVWTGSRAVLSLAFFPMLVIVIFLIQLGGVIVGPMLSLFVAELHAAENAATQAGIVIAATGAVSAISAVVIGRISDRAGRKVILTGMAVAGSAYAAGDIPGRPDAHRQCPGGRPGAGGAPGSGLRSDHRGRRPVWCRGAAAGGGHRHPSGAAGRVLHHRRRLRRSVAVGGPVAAAQ